MDFLDKLNSKNTFGMFEQGKTNNIVNIICGVLLIVLIIILIICLVRKDDKFSNQKESVVEETHMYHIVNNLDRTKERCPFSRKMTELLSENNNMINGIKVKDITIDHPLAKKFNVTGTPTILCTKLNKLSIGFKSLDQVSEDLKSENNDMSDSKVSTKDILLIGNMSCGFCLKAKTLMEQLEFDFEFVPSNSPEGLKHMKDKNSNGVPLILKISTNKTIYGFDEEEIKNLKN